MTSHRILNIATPLMALLIMAMAWSCTADTTYHKYVGVGEEGWSAHDTLVFDIDTLRTNGNFTTYVCLRAKPDFPYRYLSMIVEQTCMLSGNKERKTVRCEVVNSDGVMTGVGITYHTYEIPVFTGTHRPGEHIKVAIKHNMTREYMPGLMDVGVKLKVATK
ncbi:MAG: gliding motility lipoprotein GldH [Prevotella sp.]|nr:gliding motility lipoprotein GldH [Prevotella sp.]